MLTRSHARALQGMVVEDAMTLHGYFDDSGRGQKAVFVLAGFLSTTEGWAAFNTDWQRVLDKHPPLPAFKMKDAMGPAREWYAMGESARRARLDDFLSVISEHAMMGIGCAVDTAAWDEVIGGGLDAQEAIYQVALMAIIGFTARYRRDAGLSDRVKFTFDEQMTEFPRAVRTFARVMKGNNLLHDCVECEPVSATDEEAMPLQAADYLA